MTVQEKIQLGAFHKILDHLNMAVNDPRKRERLRARTALGQIETWIREETNAYESGNKRKDN